MPDPDRAPTRKAEPLSGEFRFPGVLNSKEMLVAEAIHARAWAVLARDEAFGSDEGARARLGQIVVRLMAGTSASVGDLATRAVADFRAGLARG